MLSSALPVILLCLSSCSRRPPCRLLHPGYKLLLIPHIQYRSYNGLGLLEKQEATATDAVSLSVATNDGQDATQHPRGNEGTPFVYDPKLASRIRLKTDFAILPDSHPAHLRQKGRVLVGEAG